MAYNDVVSKTKMQAPVNPGWVSPGVRRYLHRPVHIEAGLKFSQVVRFLLLHLPLMLIFRGLPLLATAHSLIVVLIGLHFLVKDRHPVRVAAVIAYLAGAEILWRGAESLLVWEYCKYATILLGTLAILKFRLVGRNAILPAFFVLLLLPGIFIAPVFDREAISFQLAGPVALGITSIAFGGSKFRKQDLQRIFLCTIAPAVAMGFMMVIILLTQDMSFFSYGENEIITGGIGANQVASALSLGAMAAFFFIFLSGVDLRLRNLMIWLTLALLGLSALTFSRAGVWNLAGAIAVGAVFLVRSRKGIPSVLSTTLVAGLFIYFFAYPLLNNLTGGALALRFRDFDSTKRDVLVRIDYELFQQNRLWGVGVGESPKYHIPAFGYPKPTHTEYSRLLAEHGSLGAAAMLILLLMVLERLFSRRPALSKAISMGFTSWALLYMLHSATRMVAPAFAFGLGAAAFLDEEETKN